MKHYVSLALVIATILAAIDPARAQIVDFEDLTLTDESYYDART